MMKNREEQNPCMREYPPEQHPPWKGEQAIQNLEKGAEGP